MKNIKSGVTIAACMLIFMNAAMPPAAAFGEITDPITGTAGETVSPAMAEAGETAAPAAAADGEMAAHATDAAGETDNSSCIDLGTVCHMAQKALDQQEIQNIMSRHVMYHAYGLHEEEMEQIWVQEPENQATASFGQNAGFFVGYPAIWKAYVDGHTKGWLRAARKYCDTNGIDITGWTDEEIIDVYGGVGQLMLHVTTTAIIEVAEDGQTAKCFWYTPGMIKETDQNAYSTWESYGVDFVKEDGEWKIWHLHMFTDFSGDFYMDLENISGTITAAGTEEQSEKSYKDDSETEVKDSYADDLAAGEESGERIARETANKYLSEPTYTAFSADRLRTEMMIYIPTPYETWDFEDPNYGLSIEQYAEYDIDLQAWYEAHD